MNIKSIASASCLLLLAVGVATAQSAAPVVSPTTVGSVAAQMALARQIVLHGSPQGAHACATCHGVEGQGQIKAAFPHLAGLPKPYLVRQLQHFDVLARDNPSMQAIAHKLTSDQIDALATYFSRQVPPPIMPPATPPPPLGTELALQGRDAVPACITCHGPGGRGLGGALSAAFPPIAGQPAVYIERQLRAWKQGQRPPGPDGLMGAIAKHLSAADIGAVSLYFAAQPTLVTASTTEAKP
ncbi:c-type cytochrome [Metallibacterium scheffleri]|uniref:c-type cytochrome n=1 Tax=Metallibacterium scheffleri TaxID=993689 RepID=UPI0023F469C3|nr:c-type cytochrome [Metallibacterium scheffleri]